ncbi:uncharacterized protein LOC143752049 [Siphateles boraxobius]|uniref:uncharacterized protein LOC143752049 n=1 Tax=Siphateles boraxobius TaxID=180520 RepID=UPI0040632B9E
METQRILMRSLAVVVFASVIWTIADAQQKEITCCIVYNSQTRAQFTDPIISFRLQKQSLPCLKAVVLKTERGDFCFKWRLQWVQEEVKRLRAQRNKGLISTPPPVSSISNPTTTVSANAIQEVVPCCTAVSNLTRAQFTDTIIGFRLQKQKFPLMNAVIFITERGDFCFNGSLQWVQEEVKFLRAQRNKA